MAWVAFDRMVRAVREAHMHGDVDRWEVQRDMIHAEVLAKGFNEDKNSFTQSYDTDELDASLLLIPRVGFLPGTDPRVIGTIEAIQREITQDGFVQRYRPGPTDDGLPGGEGIFVACSFWLVDALHAAGRDEEAIELYDRLLGLRNDVGLLSEEWDPVAKRQLGNTPQAFSHFPLVVSGLQLHDRRHRRSDQPVRQAHTGD
jgi:GH15 family glucan-1,4-alpha-glucosidase